MASISIGLGLGACVAVPSGDIAVPDIPDPLPELLPRPDGTIGIRLDGGTVTVTVAGSGAYDGTFTAAATALAAGPVHLLPPSAPSGPTAAPLPGDALSARAGLVLHAAGRVPTVTRRWTRNGLAIPGATGATLVVSAADQGTAIAVTETAANADGSRSATGPALAIPAVPVITIGTEPSAQALMADLGTLRAGDAVAQILARLTPSGLGAATTSGPGLVAITPALVGRIDGPALTALAEGDAVSHVRLGYAAPGAAAVTRHVGVAKVVQAALPSPAGLVDFADASRPGFARDGGVTIDAGGAITFGTINDRTISQYCAPPLLAGAGYAMTLDVTGPAGDMIGVTIDGGIPAAEAVTVVAPIPAGAGPHAIVVAFRTPAALAATTRIGLHRASATGPAIVHRAVVLAAAAPAVAVEFMVSGAPAPDGFTVALKTDVAAADVALAWSTEAGMTAATVTPATVTAAPSLVAKCRVAGAPAARRIHYQARIGGVPVGPVQSAVTAGAGGFRFAFASCGRATAAPTWGHIAARAPDFFLSLGDTPYIDYTGTDRQRFRDAHRDLLRGPARPVTAAMPWLYVWDDHDYGANNSNSATPSKAAVQEVYRETQPHYPLAGASGGIHHAFTRGAVRFVVTDLRSYRTATTMLGAAQLAWLKAQLSSAPADAAIRLVVWASTVPWISGTDADTWAGFPAERREIGDHILAEGLERRLVMVSGDAHMLAADDGTNNTFNTQGVASFPVYQSGPINQTPSVKGGPYTTAPITASQNQFSIMEVAPAEGDELTVSVRGYSNDVEQWARIITTADGQHRAAPPTSVAAPATTGGTEVGQTRTMSNGTWAGTAPISYERRWKRGTTVIAGATGATYALVTADVGSTVTGEVRASNAAGQSAWVASSGSATITAAPSQPVAPANTAAPATTGGTEVGQTRSMTDGTWTGTAPITYERRWLRGSTVIAGATGSAYTLVAADVGSTITGEVRATNAGGVSGWVASAPSAAITAAPVAGTFGTVKQAKYRYQLANTLIQMQFDTAPTAGNLLVAMIAPDKASSAHTAPAGWVRSDSHGGASEISGAVFYRVSNGSETGTQSFGWTTSNRASAQMLEIVGPFTGDPRVAFGSDKTMAQKTSVTLSADVPQAPAVAVAWYAMDSRNNAPAGASRVASDGFVLVDGAPIAVEGDGGHPLLVSATKVVEAAGPVTTTIGHTGNADGSIGFLTVFARA